MAPYFKTEGTTGGHTAVGWQSRVLGLRCGVRRARTERPADNERGEEQPLHALSKSRRVSHEGIVPDLGNLHNGEPNRLTTAPIINAIVNAINVNVATSPKVVKVTRGRALRSGG